MNRNQPDTSLPKTPAVIKYTALITQTGTDDPVITELSNTSNLTISWQRLGVGNYNAYIDTYQDMPNFNLSECASIYVQQTNPGIQVSMQQYDNVIGIYLWDGAAFIDGLTQATFELNIYTDKAKFY